MYQRNSTIKLSLNTIIIIINIKGWAIWPVPSPELQLLSSTFRLPIVFFPCGLERYDFKGIRFCGILCRCKRQFLLYSLNTSAL
jgi:hypothetical protein